MLWYVVREPYQTTSIVEDGSLLIEFLISHEILGEKNSASQPAFLCFDATVNDWTKREERKQLNEMRFSSRECVSPIDSIHEGNG